MLATKVMRRSIATIATTTPLLEAVRLLLQTNQRGLPVLDDEGHLAGIVSEGDLLHRDELGVTAPTGNWLEELLGIEEGGPARHRMRTLSVSALMTRNLVSVDENATVNDVVDLMDRRNISQVPVVCAGKVLGMVSRFELLAALERKISPIVER